MISVVSAVLWRLGKAICSVFVFLRWSREKIQLADVIWSHLVYVCVLVQTDFIDILIVFFFFILNDHSSQNVQKTVAYNGLQ